MVVEHGHMELSAANCVWSIFESEKSDVFKARWRELKNLKLLYMFRKSVLINRSAILQKMAYQRRQSMKASEIIARYETYCPHELSMEGDIQDFKSEHLIKK